MTKSNDIYKQIHKVKINGMKVKVRLMSPGEVIGTNSLMMFNPSFGNMKEFPFEEIIRHSLTRFVQSKCPKDRVSDHPQRTYVHVESPWFKPEWAGSIAV